MESMTYGSKQSITLPDVARIAEHLELKWAYVDRLSLLQLNIWEDPEKLLEILFIWEGDLAEDIFDDDESRQRFASLAPKSILVINYHVVSIPLIIKTFTPVLIEFGGWIDCRGDYLKIFTLDNINEMKDFCP